MKVNFNKRAIVLIFYEVEIYFENFLRKIIYFQISEEKLDSLILTFLIYYIKFC